MSIKVAKFGGSSLADAEQFRKVKAIIEQDQDRRFVVPSAPGKRSYKDEKVTDLFFRCQALAANGEHFEEAFDSIVERYTDIEQTLSLKTDIKGHLQQIWDNIRNHASADYAASRGEYLNGILLADFLGYEFVDASELVLFDENGRFDAERTQKTISTKMQGKSGIVIPGFYGSLPDGGIKVFPRGGSDISGAIVARGVHADVYENWTDVSGFLMADPRIVKGPATISTITYSELRELSYMGATVLHEDSIFPVKQACIPINVRNTNAPEEQGTLIIPDTDGKPLNGRLTGIAGKCGFTIISISKDNMNYEIGFGYKVLSVLTKYGISFEHMPTSIDTMSVVIAEAQIEGKRKAVVDELMEICQPDSIELHDNLALIASVGRGIINSPNVPAKLFNALAQANINVRIIDQGSSEMNIIVGVESDMFEKTVGVIYEAFKD